jgi:hypothetical protein
VRRPSSPKKSPTKKAIWANLKRIAKLWLHSIKVYLHTH